MKFSLNMPVICKLCLKDGHAHKISRRGYTFATSISSLQILDFENKMFDYVLSVAEKLKKVFT